MRPVNCLKIKIHSVNVINDFITINLNFNRVYKAGHRRHKRAHEKYRQNSVPENRNDQIENMNQSFQKAFDYKQI